MPAKKLAPRETGVTYDVVAYEQASVIRGSQVAQYFISSNHEFSILSFTQYEKFAFDFDIVFRFLSHENSCSKL